MQITNRKSGFGADVFGPGQADFFDPRAEFVIRGHRTDIFVPLQQTQYGDQIRIGQAAGHQGRALFAAPGMDEVRFDLPQGAADEQSIGPKQRRGPRPTAVLQKMEGDTVPLEGEAARDVLSQDDDVELERRVPLKFGQEHHFPGCRMFAREGAEGFWNIRQPFDREIGYPGNFDWTCGRLHDARRRCGVAGPG